MIKSAIEGVLFASVVGFLGCLALIVAPANPEQLADTARVVQAVTVATVLIRGQDEAHEQPDGEIIRDIGGMNASIFEAEPEVCQDSISKERVLRVGVDSTNLLCVDTSRTVPDSSRTQAKIPRDGIRPILFVAAVVVFFLWYLYHSAAATGK